MSYLTLLSPVTFILLHPIMSPFDQLPLASHFYSGETHMCINARQ